MKSTGIFYCDKCLICISVAFQTLLTILMQLLLLGTYKFRLCIYKKLLNEKLCDYNLCDSCKKLSEEHSLLEKTDKNDSERTYLKYNSSQN